MINKKILDIISLKINKDKIPNDYDSKIHVLLIVVTKITRNNTPTYGFLFVENAPINKGDLTWVDKDVWYKNSLTIYPKNNAYRANIPREYFEKVF